MAKAIILAIIFSLSCSLGYGEDYNYNYKEKGLEEIVDLVKWQRVVEQQLAELQAEVEELRKMVEIVNSMSNCSCDKCLDGVPIKSQPLYCQCGCH